VTLGPPRLLVAAPTRGSGKSTVSIGLAAAFRARGMVVQPFKKGPDFIDPMWLSAAAGRPCRNLDFFLMGRERIAARFAERSRGADLALVESNHGLHDGTDPAGGDSGAALALLLETPVILVVSALRLGRGVAALVRGQVDFDPEVRVAGVILNRVRGRRHEGKLRDAIERYCRVEVVGVLPDEPELEIRERHLGLTPLDEAPLLEPAIARIGEAVGRHLDLERLAAIARSAPPLATAPEEGAAAPPPVPTIRIGVARDRAFTFYYPENLEALGRAGAELVPFSPLADPRLPAVDGLYIGGGFPELFLPELAANRSLRGEIREAVERGMPVWAECGGLMYLTRSIRWQGREAAMAGVFPCDVEMADRPAGHGYVLLEETGEGPLAGGGRRLRGHEFHHSRLVDVPPDQGFAYRVLRGNGAAAGRDGLVRNNCVAGYTHLHADGAPSWAGDFAALVRSAAAGSPG
jgi:cobyrinic acid a,c-diamide synthase